MRGVFCKSENPKKKQKQRKKANYVDKQVAINQSYCFDLNKGRHISEVYISYITRFLCSKERKTLLFRDRDDDLVGKKHKKKI